MANAQNFFGFSNVYDLAKGLTIAEIFAIVGFLFCFILNGRLIYKPTYALVILIHIACLVTECIGIHKKNKCLIIFGCVIRTLEQILMVFLIINFYIFFNGLLEVVGVLLCKYNHMPGYSHSYDYLKYDQEGS